MTATSNRQLKNICVLYRFRYRKYKEFVQAAINLDRTITQTKVHLVYEGGDRWLSKLVLEDVFVRESQVLCIIPKALKLLGCLPNSPTVEELVISSMQERMSEMLNHADALIFLLGDFATSEALITFVS